MRKPRLNSAIVTIFSILGISLPINAQLLNDYGIKIGYVAANQSFMFKSKSDNLDLQNRSGFTVGVYAEWFSGPSFHVITEVNYIQKGMIDKVEKRGETECDCVHEGMIGKLERRGETEYIGSRLDYLSIPVLAKFRHDYKYFSLYLLVGPTLDALLNYESPYYSLYSAFRKFGLGGDVGIGFASDLTRTRIQALEIRYSYDLIAPYQTELLDVKNKSIEISIRLGL